jgi:hypothetical protein
MAETEEKFDKEHRGAELLKVMKNSIKDAGDTAKGLVQLFREDIQSIRMEENENMFTRFRQNILDLQCFLEYIRELRGGIDYFDGFSLPVDPISSQGYGLNLFKEMLSAFMASDWIMLSDLIEHELCPLLLKEDEWLDSLERRLQEV